VQYLTPHLATLGAVEVPAYVYDGVLRVALGLERSLF
jgi:Leu/Phe-tRNA-protein transferase